MVCNVCGHSNSEHKSVSSGFFYCSNCNTIESNVSFTVDPAASSGNNLDPSKSDDVQGDMYRSFKRIARIRYE